MRNKIKWRIVAFVFVGMCLSLSSGIIWGRLGKARWMSPSFLDTCQSSDLRHIKSLCGNNENLIHTNYSGELKFADLNCSSSEWIVGFSSGYPSFLIAFQAVLVVSTTMFSAHLDPFSVGVISTFLLLGMGMASMASNEAYISTILWSYLLGIITTFVPGFWIVFSSVLDGLQHSDMPPGNISFSEIPIYDPSATIEPWNTINVAKQSKPYNPMHPSLPSPKFAL